MPVKPGQIGRVAARRACGTKWGDEEGGSLISLDRVATSLDVGVSAFPCITESRRRFLLALAHPGSPRKRAIKRLCMCVYHIHRDFRRQQKHYNTDQSRRQCRRPRTWHTLYQSSDWRCTGSVFKTTTISAIFNIIATLVLVSAYDTQVTLFHRCAKLHVSCILQVLHIKILISC